MQKNGVYTNMCDHDSGVTDRIVKVIEARLEEIVAEVDDIPDEL